MKRNAKEYVFRQKRNFSYLPVIRKTKERMDFLFWLQKRRSIENKIDFFALLMPIQTDSSYLSTNCRVVLILSGLREIESDVDLIVGFLMYSKGFLLLKALTYVGFRIEQK